MKATVAITLTAGLPVALASAILKPRIIGPDEPTDRYKFAVSVQDSEKVHACGGILVDSTTVLTANHCLLNTTDAGFVVAGKMDLEGPGGVTVNISTLQRPFHKPIDLQPPSTKDRVGDIGIIKLETPIEKSDDIDHASLPTSDAVPDGSEELVGLGWGRNSTWKKGQAAYSVPKRAEVLLEQQPLSDSGGALVDSKTGTLVGLTSISVSNAEGISCADAGLFTKVGSYLDFINENLGQRGYTDGDNQRIKDEAKMAVLRPALLEACKKQHSDKSDVCRADAIAAFNAGGTGKPTPAELAAYSQDIDKCRAIEAMEFACNGCAREANVDSTVETVIQCSEAGKKGN